MYIICQYVVIVKIIYEAYIDSKINRKHLLQNFFRNKLHHFTPRNTIEVNKILFYINNDNLLCDSNQQRLMLPS